MSHSHRYAQVGIEALSRPQINKLLSGGRIRIKHGSHHKIHITHEHHKKLHKAHLKGAGVMIELDPYACDLNQHMLGEGLASKAKHAYHKAGHFVKQHKEAFRPLASHLKHSGHQAVADASMYALEHGLNPELVGAYGQMAHESIPAGMGLGRKFSHFVNTPLVRSVRKAVRPVAQAAFNTAEQMALAGISQAPSAMSGMGLHHKAHARKRPVKRGTGMAHRVKKAPRKGVKKGMALYPAGMGFEF